MGINTPSKHIPTPRPIPEKELDEWLEKWLKETPDKKE